MVTIDSLAGFHHCVKKNLFFFFLRSLSIKELSLNYSSRHCRHTEESEAFFSLLRATWSLLSPEHLMAACPLDIHHRL